MAAALFLAPITLPVLSEERTLDYSAFVSQALHIKKTTLQTERFRTSPLPEDFADMHGWPELVATVATIYAGLPPAQRAQAAIVASNYGEAAAIDFFGGRYGLPPALSGHNNYWLWGTHGYSGNVVIDVDGDCGRTRFSRTLSQRPARRALQSAMGYFIRTKYPDLALRRHNAAVVGAVAEAAALHLAALFRIQQRNLLRRRTKPCAEPEV